MICPLKTWSWNHDWETSYTVTTRAYLMWYSLSVTRRRTIFTPGTPASSTSKTDRGCEFFMKIIWLSCTWTKIVQNIFLSKRLADWLIDWLVVFNIIFNTQWLYIWWSVLVEEVCQLLVEGRFLLRALRLPPLVKLTAIYISMFIHVAIVC
jgi:hypothetical protein